MRISDWSSDVCSSDLVRWTSTRAENLMVDSHGRDHYTRCRMAFRSDGAILGLEVESIANLGAYMTAYGAGIAAYLYTGALSGAYRSEEHTSELQSLILFSYAVFCLKKTKMNTY